jgi:protein-S-isoprenylcysteine O-methyltransferase Ste14
MGSRNWTFGVRVAIQLLVFAVGVPFLPLLVSWHWNWWEAWVFALVCILGFIVSRILAARHHPGLVAERARFGQQADAKRWDKVLSSLLVFGGGAAPLVVGLDERFGWTPDLSLPVKVGSLAVILAGYLLSSYALVENQFFSGVVRIQTDRGHYVVSGGPYAWVRHPGYAGGLLIYLATPLFLDSLWAYLPALVLLGLLVVRTRLEDKTLMAELDGYSEYADLVRYRLLPGIW